MGSHSFNRGIVRVFAAKIEFEAFQKEIASAVKVLPKGERFKALEDAYSFYARTETPKNNGGDPISQVDLRLGNRILPQRGGQSKIVTEQGASLLYSLELGLGSVAIALYPASSEVGGAIEEHIYLDVGHYTAHQLKSRLKSDFRDFVAYAHVTSLDGDPTILERMRVQWLRLTRSTRRDEKFEAAKVWKYALRGAGVLIGAVFTALLKPFGIVVAVAILVALGFDRAAELLAVR